MNSDSDDWFDNREEFSARISAERAGIGDAADAQIVDAEIVATDSDPVSLSVGGMLSWLVIVVTTAAMMMLVVAEKTVDESNTAPETSVAQLLQVQMQGKLIVAQRMLAKLAEDGVDEVEILEADADVVEGLVEAAEKTVEPETTAEIEKVLPQLLNHGPYAQRIAYAILLNEVAGADVAFESLAETDQRLKDAGLELSEDQQRLRKVVAGLFESYAKQDWAASKVSDDDKNWLTEKMSWIGKLAQAPVFAAAPDLRTAVETEAMMTLVKSGIAMLVGFLCGIAGLVLAVILLVKLSQGKLASQFEHRASRHNIYVETFAIWMAVFFGGQILMGAILQSLGLPEGVTALALTPVIFFGSLIALAWPVVRGVSFADVRCDIGWRGNLFTESITGLMAYLALIPAVMLAFIVVLIMMATFAAIASPEDFSHTGGPSHPIQEMIMQGDLLVIGFVILAACVAAPIVEETMFRGVLYRHLRDWTAGWRIGASVVLSCVVGSFVFAAIHPQGIYGVPLLMTLAIGFSLVREWRDSLLAAITMHAINNAAVTLVMLLVL